jgi:hypothetical protein
LLLFWRNKFLKSAIAGNAKPVSIEEITETTDAAENHCNLRKIWDDDFISRIHVPIAKAKLLIHLL